MNVSNSSFIRKINDSFGILMASRFLPLIFKFDEEFTEIFVVNKARLNFRKCVF